MKNPYDILFLTQGVMKQSVVALQDYYEDDWESLTKAPIPELMKLKEVGKQSAECIHAFFHEPAYELWHNENIRSSQNKMSEYKVIKDVLGNKIATIMRNNNITAESIKSLSLEESEKLFLDTIISLTQFQKVYDYFHLTGYEFHSRSKEVIKKKRKEYHTTYPDDTLNKVLGMILEEKNRRLGKKH